MTTAEIEYCVPRGFLDGAEAIQRALRRQFGERPDRAALVTGDRGVLPVAVDGETAWDRADDEYGVAEGTSAAHQTQSGDVDDITRRVRGGALRR